MLIKHIKYITDFKSIWNIDGTIVELTRYVMSPKDPNRFITLYSELQIILINKSSLINVVNKFSFDGVVTVMFTFYGELSVQYLRHYAKIYIDRSLHSKLLKQNEVPSYEFIKYVFGINGHSAKRHKESVTYIKEILEKNYNLFICEKIKNCIAKKDSLASISKNVGWFNILYFGFNEYEGLLKEYIAYFAKQFTVNREVITYNKLKNKMFGKKVNHDISDKYESRNSRYFEINKYKKVIKEIVDLEYEKQKKEFIENNIAEIKSNKDAWKLFYMQGPGLKFTTFDFSKINCVGIRREVKLFMKERICNDRKITDDIIDSLISALNTITNFRSNINFFCDITKTDIRAMISYFEDTNVPQKHKTFSIATIKKRVESCGLVVDFLMKDENKEMIKSPKPHYNYFRDFSFRNTKKMYKRTAIIPDEVVEEISKHITELNIFYQTIYAIFINLGIRCKEVIHIEEGCLQPSRYKGVSLLRFTPYKVLESRRKNNLDDYRELLISEKVANMIEMQIERTKELRKKYNCPYIFINQYPHRRAYLTKGAGFVVAIQRLIKKHGITDKDGQLWHFTSRQFRKTLAVKAIENGASSAEVAYLLGVLQGTALDYYEEVREIKLADMTSEYYKKKFDLIISENNLSNYTEDERRFLYVDFMLGMREVPLGKCMKKFTDKPCGYEIGRSDCSSCDKIASGCKYMGEWVRLRDDRKKAITELEEIYKRENIPKEQYKTFREYECEVYFFTTYQAVIDKIEEYENNRKGS